MRVEPLNLAGTRNLQQQTASAAVRDYLESWQALTAAFAQNRAALLDRDFVGIARQRLGNTMQQQSELGLRTQYRDLGHDIRVVFYSPEGLSLELEDYVEYDIQLFDHGSSKGLQHMKAKYVVVMTPAETRWRIRVFQAEAQ
ncbi:MAG: hypothetical protein WCC26_00945 [Terracidiphilus sp.]